MSKQTKIILAVVGGILVLCGIVCVVGALLTGVIGSRAAKTISDSANQDPAAVQAAASQIADFDLPAGYSPLTSISILNIKMVMYRGSQEDNFITLVQMPTQGSVDDATMQQLETVMGQQSGRRLQNQKIIEQRDLTIRGAPAKLIIQEGSYSNSQSGSAVTYRQALVAFQGKSGLAMLGIFGPSASWDQPAMDAMVKSIR